MRLVGGVEVERGRAGGGDDGTDGDWRIIQVGRGEDLVIDVGGAVPNDELIGGVYTGDAQDRIRIERIGSGDQLSVIGHAVAVRISRPGNGDRARIAQVNLIGEDDLDNVGAGRRIRPVIGKGAKPGAARVVPNIVEGETIARAARLQDAIDQDAEVGSLSIVGGEGGREAGEMRKLIRAEDQNEPSVEGLLIAKVWLGAVVLSVRVSVVKRSVKTVEVNSFKRTVMVAVPLLGTPA